MANIVCLRADGQSRATSTHRSSPPSRLISIIINTRKYDSVRLPPPAGAWNRAASNAADALLSITGTVPSIDEPAIVGYQSKQAITGLGGVLLSQREKFDW